MSRTGDAFLAHLANRAATVSRAKKKRAPKRKRIRPLKQPDNLRRKYAKEIRDEVLAPAIERVRSDVLAHGETLVAENAGRSDAIEVVRLDTPSKASKLVRKMSEDFFAEFTDEKLRPLARSIAVETSAQHKKEMAAQFKAAISIDLPFKDANLAAMIEDFTAENVALIRTIPERLFADVETTLIRDLKNGLRWEEIAGDIADRFGVSDSRAELIARDQVGKFFGALNEQRQKDVGVERYTWRTARDNRVREEHMEREGVVYAWGELDPDEEPGQPINCRCQAEPDLAALLEAMEGD